MNTNLSYSNAGTARNRNNNLANTFTTFSTCLKNSPLLEGLGEAKIPVQTIKNCIFAEINLKEQNYVKCTKYATSNT
jgi:hypothetical protein